MSMETTMIRKRMPVSALVDPKIVVPAIGAAFAKLDPRTLIKNPVMFVVEVVAALTTIIFIRELFTGGENLGFTFQIIVWLWITVLFANFSEAVAEGRGKAQAESLRRTRTEMQAKLLTGYRRDGTSSSFPARRSRSATSSWSKPGTPSRRTARSSRASPRSMKLRSPANRRRSSASSAATARRSRAERKCCRTGSGCGLRPLPARPSSTV